MSERVTLELPEELARRARAEAAQTQKLFEEVLVEWMRRAGGEPAVDSLSDSEVLALCDSQLNDPLQDELSDLLLANREGALESSHSARLEELMQLYRQGLIRKAQALKTAVARGLRPRIG